jgi:hypothetical protein
LTRGDLVLKLRQAGIDPATVDLEGATSISVTQAGTGDEAQPSADATTAKPSAPAVRPGDEIDIFLVDGPVSIRTKAIAVSGGAVGDTITARRGDSPRPLTVTIIAAGQATLEE